tara:strand:+ start:338 stop:484 length:147 start_codon:yes stop_codon:yes gene_type:complete
MPIGRISEFNISGKGFFSKPKYPTCATTKRPTAMVGMMMVLAFATLMI